MLGGTNTPKNGTSQGIRTKVYINGDYEINSHFFVLKGYNGLLNAAQETGSFNVNENIWHDLGQGVGTVNYHIQYDSSQKSNDGVNFWKIALGIGAGLLIIAALVLFCVKFWKYKKNKED